MPLVNFYPRKDLIIKKVIFMQALNEENLSSVVLLPSWRLDSIVYSGVLVNSAVENEYWQWRKFLNISFVNTSHSEIK